MSISRLKTKIGKAASAGRKALIPYLPYGFPDRERFWAEIEALDASGADVIEIGVPFSDPVADGPVVEQAALKALEQGVTLAELLKELAARRGRFQAEIVLMGYLNPFLRYGFEAFAADAEAAGVAGCIIPDLPHEEAAGFQKILADRGLDLVALVGLNTSPERMRLYAASATGFVYFVAVLGTTGVRDNFSRDIGGKLAQAREIFDLPLALGFGISRPEQLQGLQDRIDAVVFGSALIRHIEGGDSARSFMSAWSTDAEADS
jgi:tryptophan synthase alpha chain